MSANLTAPMLAPPKQRLRSFNNGLTGLLVVLGLYIIVAPFGPQLIWWLHPPRYNPAAPAAHATAAHAPIPADNRLKIDRLGMDQIIHDGPTASELSKGVWLVPQTSTPDKKSNTVIIGHRFTYAGPAVFYFLDKIQLHDTIVVDWRHKEYTYQVRHMQIVPPTDIAVQKPSRTAELTLYTCTPLWTAKNRLVIVAPLQKVRT